MTPHDFAQHVLSLQPFSRQLGTELLEASSDGVVFALDVTQAHLQQHGIVHGGVLSALADMALAFAGGMAMGSDVVTSEFKINFVAPARGTRLLVDGKVLGMSARQAVVQARISSFRDGEETLCCVAQGTITRVKGVVPEAAMNLAPQTA
ncbi:PaaI family thioesterase [Hasllibacter sp. MH4015]|uniref:PaaI family thioesterase n=1 Tax=Hasllibacter sp. MH4015 TaxID=2854029 RepID=UPI001CD384DA|nr:PaaI family thioesterase [Hasllibacter sp. MH4015]